MMSTSSSKAKVTIKIPKQATNDENPDYKSALQTFFRLKNRYETSKRRACPNCGQKVLNTDNVFTLSKNVYKVACPNRESPCGLQIEIFNGDYASVQDLLLKYRETFEDIKQRILQLRMKYIFWYGTSIGESTAKENKVFTEEFKKLMNQFIIAKQQYNEVVEQYHHTNFLDKERKLEVDSISNTIMNTYTKLRDAFPDLVLSWDANVESNQEIVTTMIKEQMAADEAKHTRDNIMYSVRGFKTVINSDGVPLSNGVQYVGALDNIAFNTSGREPTVRKFKLSETKDESSNSIESLREELDENDEFDY